MSQNEARDWRAKAGRLAQYIQNQRSRWTARWFESGIFLGEIDSPERLAGCLETARKLQHPVIASLDSTGKMIQFFADPVEAPDQIAKAVKP